MLTVCVVQAYDLCKKASQPARHLEWASQHTGWSAAETGCVLQVQTNLDLSVAADGFGLGTVNVSNYNIVIFGKTLT